MIVAPEMLGSMVRETVEGLVQHERKASRHALLYAVKPGGFSCRTCKYSTPANATHGKCMILTGTINLDEGCCMAWDADPKLLHLYEEPEDETME